MTAWRHAAAAAVRPAPRPAGCCRGGSLGGALLYWSQAVERRGPLRRRRRSSTRPRRAWPSNAAFIAMTGPARALEHDRRRGRLAGLGVRRDRRRPDEHVPGRPAHPRRGGDRPRRAGPRRRGRPARPAGRRAARRRWSPTSCSAGSSRPAWSATASRSPGRSPRPRGRAGRAGLRRASRWSPRSSPRTTRAMYGVAGAVIGGVVRAARRRRRRQRRAVVAVADRLGAAMHAFSGDRWWPALLLGRGRRGRSSARRCVLFDRRDFGAGVVAARPGPAHGGPRPAGLARAGLAAAARQRWSAGRSGCSWPGWRTARSATTSRTCVGDSELSQDVFAQAGGSLVDSFYARRGADARADRGRLRDLVDAASARRGGRRPRRDRCSPRRCHGGGGRLSHLAMTVGGTVLVVGAAGLGLGLGYTAGHRRRLGASAGCSVPPCRTSRRCWCWSRSPGSRTAWRPAGRASAGWPSRSASSSCSSASCCGFPQWVIGPVAVLAPGAGARRAVRLGPCSWLARPGRALGAAGFAALRHRDLG